MPSTRNSNRNGAFETHRGPSMTLAFANAPFLFKFLVPGINEMDTQLDSHM
jgi:hypothetical protein